MKYYYQSNTKIYFLKKDQKVYSCKEKQGKAKSEGKNILKNAFPKPKEISEKDLPEKVKKAFEKKLKEEYMKKDNMIIIKEDFQIPGTDIILEAGDRILIQELTSNSWKGDQNSKFSSIASDALILEKNGLIITVYKHNYDNNFSIVVEKKEKVIDNIVKPNVSAIGSFLKKNYPEFAFEDSEKFYLDPKQQRPLKRR